MKYIACILLLTGCRFGPPETSSEVLDVKTKEGCFAAGGAKFYTGYVGGGAGGADVCEFHNHAAQAPSSEEK